MKGSGSWLVAEHAHDLLARDLDQVTAAKGPDQRRGLVHQWTEVGCFHLPALGTLADYELGVGVDQQAVVAGAAAGLLNAAGQVFERRDQGSVLSFVVGGSAEVQADGLLFPVSCGQTRLMASGNRAMESSLGLRLIADREPAPYDLGARSLASAPFGCIMQQCGPQRDLSEMPRPFSLKMDPPLPERSCGRMMCESVVPSSVWPGTKTPSI